MDDEPPVDGIRREATHPETSKTQHSMASARSRRALRRPNPSSPRGSSVASQIRCCLPGSRGQRSSAPATLVATVTVTVVVAPSAAVAGLTRHVAWAGIEVQANATVPGTPAAEESSSGYTASEPAEIVAVVLPFAFSAKSTPVPVN